MRNVFSTKKQMTKIRKPILSIVIVLVIILSSSYLVFAANTNVATASELSTALGSATDGDTISLTSDITSTMEDNRNISKSLTINGNGHSITFIDQNNYVLSIIGCDVTLSNIIINGGISVSDGATLRLGSNVTINNPTEGSSAVFVAGTLIVDGATISGGNTGIGANGTTAIVNMNSGDISGQYYGISAHAGARVSVLGGTVRATEANSGAGIYSAGGNNTVVDVQNNATVYGNSGISIDGLNTSTPVLNISGSASINGVTDGLNIRNGAHANITGGTINATGQYGTGIYANGGSSTKVDIHSCIITGNTGTVTDGPVILNLFDSAQITGVNTGLSVRNGAQVNITGGTISATGQYGIGIDSFGDNTVVNIQSASISGKTGINTNGSNCVSSPPLINISNSAQITGVDLGLYISDGAKVYIMGGTISATGQYGNGIYLTGENTSEVTVSGGIVSGNTAIYANGQYSQSNSYIQVAHPPVITISNSANIVGINTGIYLNSGAAANITGGTVTSAAEYGNAIFLLGDYGTVANVSGGNISGSTGISLYGKYNDSGTWIQATNPPSLNISGSAYISGTTGSGITANYHSTVNATGGTIYGKINGISSDNDCNIDTTGAMVICGNNPPDLSIMSINLSGAGIQIPVTLLHSQNSYDISIPADLNSFDLIPVDNSSNAVFDIEVRNINTYGSSGISGNNVSFDSATGSIVLQIDVKLAYNNQVETFPVTLNLFQPKFNGITVTPNVIAGDWGISHNDFNYGAPANVFVGASSVRLSLPDTDNNEVASFDITGFELDDGTIVSPESLGVSVEAGTNDYTIPLSTSLTYETKVHIRETFANNLTRDVVLTITKLALSSGSLLEQNGDFTTKVNYTADPSFTFSSPKLLVVYYHYDGTEYKILNTETFDLPDYDASNPVTVVDVESGNTSNNAANVANMIGVFLVSGDVSASSTEFGGVKYGGAGWYELLPNHQ